MGWAPYMYKSNWGSKNPEEIYHVPASIYPHFVTIKYSWFCPFYWMSKKKYELGAFSMMNIPIEELNKTCNEATKIMKHLRGKVALFDLISLILLCGIIWLVILISVLLSVYVHAAVGVILFVLYLCMVGAWILCTRSRAKFILWWSHFALGLFLWAENNWYYINKNCLLRPGYNAKWIEFIFETKRVK